MLCYLCVLSLGCSHLVVSTSASDWLERLVFEMTYNVLMGTLNPTHSLTHSFTHSLTQSFSHSQQLMFLLRCSVWKGSRHDEQTCCESADSRQFCRLPQLHGLGPGLILLFTARVSYLTLPYHPGQAFYRLVLRLPSGPVLIPVLTQSLPKPCALCRCLQTWE